MKTSLRSFQKLVPAEYAKWLMRTGQEAKLGGERRHVTVSFADLVGFTRLSERVSPEKLGEILAEYFDVLSEEVTKTGGTVDKFNGDDVMSFWGAPVPVDNPALKACLSALESERTLDRLYPEFEERGIPILGVSFGISTGDVIVGNVGSSQRMNYTVIGDAVNLASRLEGLNRMYGTRILIGDTTLAEAGSSLVTRQVDWVAVHGKRQATGIHEVIEETDRCSADTIRMAKLHTKAMQSYRARDWDEAEMLLKQVLEIQPNDKPAELVLARISDFRENPPDEDWDGVLQMTWK
jgi:adenylate cyclase